MEEAYRQLSMFCKRKNGKSYAKRDYEEVAKDMKVLYDEDPVLCLKVTFVIRGICRYVGNGKVYGLNQRKEGVMRMYWLMKNHPNVFYLNIRSYLKFGTWKDIIDIWVMDLMALGVEGSTINYGLITRMLLNDIASNSNLAAAALPTIRRNTVCTTQHKKMKNIVGKMIRKEMPSSENFTQNLFYRKIKRDYGKIKIKFVNIDFMLDSDILFKKLIKQSVLKAIKMPHDKK